jgi:hypothetical protein
LVLYRCFFQDQERRLGHTTIIQNTDDGLNCLKKIHALTAHTSGVAVVVTNLKHSHQLTDLTTWSPHCGRKNVEVIYRCEPHKPMAYCKKCKREVTLKMTNKYLEFLNAIKVVERL